MKALGLGVWDGLRTSGCIHTYMFISVYMCIYIYISLDLIICLYTFPITTTRNSLRNLNLKSEPLVPNMCCYQLRRS